jgi:hypothetical protein
MPNYLKAAQLLGAKGSEIRDVAEMIESYDQATGPTAKKFQIEALEKLIKLRKFMNPYTRAAMIELLKKEGIA